METILATETLKTGETLNVACIVAPDSTREDQIRPFLAHKPTNYRAHIDAAFAGRCDDLETRFYIGLLEGEMVGNIMTVESGGVGIFGHVHTREDQRRKGICDAIMRHQMEDFRRRNGHVLLLGTGYQSAPYRIYEKHGFRDWKPLIPGRMRFDSETDGVFETRFYAQAPTSVVSAHWKHWPLVALLASLPSPAYLRSLTMPIWGPSLLEGPYSKFMHEHGQRSDTRANVLESETGAVLAMATCMLDTRWPGLHILDLFAHPDVELEPLKRLLETFELPVGAVQSYADPRDLQKIAALEQCGFQRIAVLPNQYRENDAWRDVCLYASTPNPARF